MLIWSHEDSGQYYFLKVFDLSKVESPGASSFLTGDEISRYQKITDIRSKEVFLKSRWILKGLIQEALKVPVQDIQFSEKGDGKPYLENSDFEFNISHKCEILLVGYSRKCTIGVDLEIFNSEFYRPKVAARFMGESELKSIESVPKDSQLRFLKCWGIKESIVKLQGRGMFKDASSIQIDIDSLKIKALPESYSSNEEIHLEWIRAHENLLISVARKKKSPSF